MAKVSIIIPVYNHARELPTSLESIFNQTLKDFEVIAVNDGSTDNLVEILPAWETKIQVINQSNQGAAAARNAGSKLAKGEYLIFWDADVTANRELLEKMVKVLDNQPDISFVYSSFKFGWKKFSCGSFDKEKLKKINYITTTALLRRKDFPGFDENLKKFQDWDLWLTMVELGKAGAWLPEVLFTVKPRRVGMSSWLPSFFYRLQFLKTRRVKEYNYWRDIILRKHGKLAKTNPFN